MKIGINGYEAVVPRFGYNKDTGLPNRVGSSVYCFELLNNLSKIDKENNYEIFLPQSPTNDLPKATEAWKYRVLAARKMWTITSLSLELLKNRSLDVFFTPTHYLPLFAPKKSVVSILDVSYIYFPELFKKKDLIQLKKWTKYSAKKSKKILTISESSKNDIIREYGVSGEKVKVIYPGIRQVSSIEYGVLSMDELSKKFGIEKKYILFVGTLQPRKNITRLIEAYSKIETDVNLIVVGRRGWKFEEILSAPEKYNVKDKVIFLENVSDEELPSLYKNAEFFILPSLYEGFGIPVLEAMNYGTAVITSKISSLPEVGGNAALYVDPNDTMDMVEKMKKLLNDENLRKQLVEKGKKQTEKFSWEKSARETLAVLEEVGRG
ncbi:glycosyltransferase family 4 protein [Candidatus Roizmanbacteria bacterium]|nr:glycosyltransferase family 4 protein [Candidatus Roizmanbacteria bacterium]